MQRLILEVADLRVVIDGPALLTFSAHRQAGSLTREACGIVMGREWDGTLEITEATPPQKSDRRQRTGYVRMPAGHLALARQRWKASGGLIGYLGEWHSHPEDEAYPSGRDLQSSRDLARRNGCRILSFIIGLRTSYAYCRNGGVDRRRTICAITSSRST
ncbi:MAG TPA: hypothetical protein DCP03_12845 [Polaromonas sp.]|uniref:Mov34/MPN/PAD-1 family protein n=1 Tax=Polaromonas sp. UBA4122 TaxID=1947074 RepID=UPI000EE84A87|nr:hypothetical protein [Polaromonas sp.]